MADYHSAPTNPKARKEHRCIYCGGPIVVAEQYVQQTGTYDGRPYRNRFHAECYEACGDECSDMGDWEFMPYSADYPERVRVIVEGRRAAPQEQPR